MTNKMALRIQIFLAASANINQQNMQASVMISSGVRLSKFGDV